MFRLPSPATVISMLALLIALGGAGYSATGGNFILGQTNTASTQTRLATPLATAALRVDNASTAVGATGIAIITPATRPPLAVTSSVKVARLNADLLDGLTANQFGRVAYAETNNTAWSEDGRTTLLTVTLVAAQKGFVTLAGGAVAAYSNGCAYCSVHTRFRIDSTTDTSTAGAIINQTGIEQYAPLSHTVTVPVNAGTHTYALVGSWFDVSATNIDPDVWYDSTLSAQFIPFNGTGTTTAPLAVRVTKRPLVGSSRAQARR